MTIPENQDSPSLIADQLGKHFEKIRNAPEILGLRDVMVAAGKTPEEAEKRIEEIYFGRDLS